MAHFDVIVIGTGVAGQTAAGELPAHEVRVAVADAREYGGTCALRGCEPKKVLFSAAQAAASARALSGAGVTGEPGLDWGRLMEFKRTFTAPVSSRVERWLADAGVTTLHGAARFLDSERIDIGGVTHHADAFIVATGSVPVDLGIPGAELVIDSEAFMELDSLPARIVFVGGGFVSFELAHIAHVAGARCTILHRSSPVLAGFEPELAALLADSYRAEGISVITDAPVVGVARAGGALAVTCADGTIVGCDLVVHGAGRRPDLDGLDLDAAGVRHSHAGIDVDETMRSVSNNRVFAAGDAAALGAPLTPVAIRQARVAIATILGRGADSFTPDVTASAVFSGPPLSRVGLTEAEARAAGLDVDVTFTDTSGWASSRRLGQTVSAAKTIVERSSGRIVGAHFLGHGAENTANVIAAAMTGGVSARDLRRTLWAYPSESSELVYLF